jgi:hypothetical protein
MKSEILPFTENNPKSKIVLGIVDDPKGNTGNEIPQ